jgi:hypothetical protein
LQSGENPALARLLLAEIAAYFAPSLTSIRKTEQLESWLRN